ncbi:N-acetylglucosamine kinase [Rubellimicrobium arenae]|uniref:N-acetylglucosamine kinase n=1 Tax=Rubellimicrobium arenae TaxID=2817372 RepID=UPI001B3121DA|nr:BadF/BadG/BcrA/BcrD ATPase family protein [Rubellimicrobium arenae]
MADDGKWVAAMDGGGTKTAAALANQHGEVTILPRGAGCNPQDGPGWDGVLREVLTSALAVPGGLAAAVLGLPGHGEVPAHDAAALALLHDLLRLPFEAMNDVFLAHLGAFGGDSGVLILSGTGSMAVARGPQGQARVGGWGNAFGDEGSAFAIGREALLVASRILDGRLPRGEGFAEALSARLGEHAQGAFAPLTWLMAQPGSARAAIAGLAREVDALAEEGFVEARIILNEAADDLVWQARTAARQAGLSEPFRWSHAGSAFRSRTLLTGVGEELGPPEEPRLSALGGGLRRAAELAGWSPDADWAAQVDGQLRALA